jgi:hypothetical protein
MPVIRLLFALTIFVVIGYFVLLSSARAEGRLKSFGRILAIWMFVLPVLALIAAAAHGGRHDGWRGRMMRHGPPPDFRPPPGMPYSAPQPAPPPTNVAPPPPTK